MTMTIDSINVFISAALLKPGEERRGVMSYFWKHMLGKGNGNSIEAYKKKIK